MFVAGEMPKRVIDHSERGGGHFRGARRGAITRFHRDNEVARAHDGHRRSLNCSLF